jgi:nitrite reductase/ring-hydroxylating ferredoxin subunit
MAPDHPGDAAARPELTPGPDAVSDGWWFAALGSELKPGRLQRYDIQGEPVLLGRTGSGALYALRDICPHRAAPFSAGRLVEDGGEPEVECPYHGWRFGVDGICRAIPSLIDGEQADIARIRVRSYPVRESQGLVWIWTASDPRRPTAPANDPPMFDGVEGLRPRVVERREVDRPLDYAATPGLRWTRVRLGRKVVPVLTCLTPLDGTRTRITEVMWSDHPAAGLLAPVVRRRIRARVGFSAPEA